MNLRTLSMSHLLRLEEHAPEPETEPVIEEKIPWYIPLIPGEGYLITPIIIYLNIAVYLIMVASGVSAFLPEVDHMINWGASNRGLVLEGGYWRLLVSNYLHYGIIHLLLNVYALMYIGSMLEPLIGQKKFALAYTLSGILGSIVSIYWHDNSAGAGASGAVFGMYGVFIALLLGKIISGEDRKQLLSSMGIFVLYNLVFGLKGNIDNAAHIGGLLSGLLIGFMLIPGLKNPDESKFNLLAYLGPILASSVIGLAILGSLSQVSPSYGQYLSGFTLKEEKALQVFDQAIQQNLLQFDATTQEAAQIWTQIITDLSQFRDEGNLNDDEARVNNLLIRYAQLRLKEVRLLIPLVKMEAQESTEAEFEFTRVQIQQTLDSLNQE